MAGKIKGCAINSLQLDHRRYVQVFKNTQESTKILRSAESKCLLLGSPEPRLRNTENDTRIKIGLDRANSKLPDLHKKQGPLKYLRNFLPTNTPHTHNLWHQVCGGTSKFRSHLGTLKEEEAEIALREKDRECQIKARIWDCLIGKLCYCPDF